MARAAWGHLRAADADTALAYYAPNAVLAGDGRLYESLEEFATDARAFYESLAEVRVAEWIEPQVEVLNERVAVFASRVLWSSTSETGDRLDLDGAWTAVWVRRPDGWRIIARHESFRRPAHAT